MKPILTIQYLRAIAALLVVFYHHVNTLRDTYAPTIGHFEVGAFGVDIFFVISGFIMWSISEARPTSPGDFMLRRIIRIVPVYWAFTLIAAFVSTNNGISIAMPDDIVRLLCSLFFIPQWNAEYPHLVAPTLLVGWTLNLEMVFYALFAGALFLKPAWRLPALCAVLFLMGAARLVIGLSPHPAINLYSSSVILEFGFGVLLAETYRKDLAARITALSTAAGWAIPIGLIIAAIGILNLQEALPPVRALYWGLPALMIVAAGLFLEPLIAHRPVRLFKFLGDASYSIYLSHLMAMAFGQKLIGATIGAAAPLLALFGEVVFAAAFGGLAYLFLEKPLTEIVKRLVAGDLAGALKAIPFLGPILAPAVLKSRGS